MTVPKIGTQTGIVASNLALKALDPAHTVAYDNLAATQTTLVAGHNSTLDRLAAIEARLPGFPFVASSSRGGS